MCMRCLQSVRICKLLKTPPRFNPSRIDAIEMTLAAVMNGKGNGNKDEVGLKTFGEISRSPSSLLVEWFYDIPPVPVHDNMVLCQFLYMAIGTISTGGKDPAGRPMGSVIASTRGNIEWTDDVEIIDRDKDGMKKLSEMKMSLKWLSGIKYFGGGPTVRVPFAWFHLCITINYLPSKEAVRWAE